MFLHYSVVPPVLKVSEDHFHFKHFFFSFRQGEAERGARPVRQLLHLGHEAEHDILCKVRAVRAPQRGRPRLQLPCHQRLLLLQVGALRIQGIIGL